MNHTALKIELGHSTPNLHPVAKIRQCTILFKSTPFSPRNMSYMSSVMEVKCLPKNLMIVVLGVGRNKAYFLIKEMITMK